MESNAKFIEVDAGTPAQSLRDAKTAVEDGSNVVLDFSRVKKIDTPALAAAEELTTAASEHGAEVAVSGMNVQIYKVFKLARLDSRLAFRA